MIDLDTFLQEIDSPSLSKSKEIYLELTILLITERVTYEEWKAFTKFFGNFHYQLPAERTRSNDLFSYLLSRFGADHLFKLSILASHIEAHLTDEDQFKLLQLLNAKAARRMEKSPENCAILHRRARRK